MSKRENEVTELFNVGIQEMAKKTDDNQLSIIDIKAAIAEQDIPVSALYSNQDLAANDGVLTLVHDAKVSAKQGITQENIILKKRVKTLSAFKDRTDTSGLVDGSKTLANKGARIVSYIKARLISGRGVDLSGDLTNEQRQEKVNEAITDELLLMKEQGITFKTKEEIDRSEEGKVFDDDGGPDDTDWTDPDQNPLLQEPGSKKEDSQE